ncbi:DUF1064 domain-containing protein [Roseiconus lacunae]|uniref:DUF1064 domain-containing protein n=1 Tax=Roseiconus lacunae TaxID=2605694 RepID=A0ABT7PH53_9BACT|nr:DUF1064 domain-containing protein [Roseiconus lacunae]MDM4015838.1 DUF1064 domain-containing protein [Roseiconus lacunae]
MARKRGSLPSLRGLSIGHKYNAVSVTTDGIRFDSTAEANYYHQLKLRVAAGDVVVFLRQVPFHLPGGVKYVCDFQEFHADGSVHFVDVKGHETAQFKAKKKQVETLYAPIKIEVVREVL